MADNGVVDLDLLRPKPRFVKLGGNEIDVSFVPCGITFELEEIVQGMAKLSQDDLSSGDATATRRGFDLAIDLCALFCRREHPEMTHEWFMANTDAGQIGTFAEAVKTALVRSYEGAGQYQRNPRKRATKETAKST